MAKPHSHFSFSVFLAAGYAVAGTYWNFDPEVITLATVILVIAGMLPNIDEGRGAPAQELAGLVAAVVPLLLVESMPAIRQGGVSRVALVVVCSFVLTRMLISRGLQHWFTHRGVVHSIPAAIITFEMVYLFFGDMPGRERLYLSTAAFAGFLSHLIIDAYGSHDLVAKAMGQAEKKPGALKLCGATWGQTFSLYTTMTVLGYYVVRDLYPQFRVFAGVQY